MSTKVTKCRSRVLFFAPLTRNGKIVDVQLTEVGFQEKIKVKKGDTVLVNAKNYNGKYTVHDAHMPADAEGGTVVINAPYVNTGQKDKDQLLIDTTGGGISVCEADMPSGKISPKNDPKTSTTSKSEGSAAGEEEESGSDAPVKKKKKINWPLVIGIFVVVVFLLWYFNRKPKAVENAPQT